MTTPNLQLFTRRQDYNIIYQWYIFKWTAASASLMSFMPLQFLTSCYISIITNGYVVIVCCCADHDLIAPQSLASAGSIVSVRLLKKSWRSHWFVKFGKRHQRATARWCINTAPFGGWRWTKQHHHRHQFLKSLIVTALWSNEEAELVSRQRRKHPNSSHKMHRCRWHRVFSGRCHSICGWDHSTRYFSFISLSLFAPASSYWDTDCQFIILLYFKQDKHIAWCWNGIPIGVQSSMLYHAVILRWELKLFLSLQTNFADATSTDLSCSTQLDLSTPDSPAISPLTIFWLLMQSCSLQCSFRYSTIDFPSFLNNSSSSMT